VYKSENHPFWFIEEIRTTRSKTSGWEDNFIEFHFYISDEFIGTEHESTLINDLGGNLRLAEIARTGNKILNEYKLKSKNEIINLKSRISKINSILDKVK
jgi:hexokinase